MVTIFKYLLHRIEEIENQFVETEINLHEKLKNTLNSYDFDSYSAIKSALWDIVAGITWIIKLKRYKKFEIHLHCNYSSSKEYVIFKNGVRTPITMMIDANDNFDLFLLRSHRQSRVFY